MRECQLLLFSTDEHTIAASDAGGVAGYIVDWECKGKAGRQSRLDTQINHNSLEDLIRVRSATDKLVLCRVNNFATCVRERNKEIDLAVDNGADEILLPMVRSVREVENVLDHINSRCDLGILIETCESVALARELGELPLSRVYLGLNDLAIERNTRNIFSALEDGTVDRVRQQVRAPFGFAGLTLPEKGYPIPCRLLMSELVRLTCSFTFLRRTFLADTQDRNLTLEIPRILDALSDTNNYSDNELESQRLWINEVIRESAPYFQNKGGREREDFIDV